MLGAIIGDIVGSVYEFHNYRHKDFEPLFHRKAFFTDDTVCTVAIADALVNARHPAHALKDWGEPVRICGNDTGLHEVGTMHSCIAPACK